MEFIKTQPSTSEEKLLQLIRKKSKPVSDKPLTPSSSEVSFKKNIDFLAWTIRVLWIIVMGIILVVFMVFRQEMFGVGISRDVISKELGVDSVEKESSAEQAPVESVARSFEPYRQMMASRDIFQAPWEKPVVVEEKKNNLSVDFSKQLKLVGILLDKDPKAIVEDLTTQQTFFLSPGDKIGGAVVEQIRQDKVILDFEQEKVELVP